MTNAHAGTAAFAVILLLAGCATKIGRSAQYDPTPLGLNGTITLSEPKVYRREALISERAKDLARIQKLIDDVPNIQFTPAIYRQVEHISATAAALGLNFDPALGEEYRRSQEIAGIEHKIKMLELQAKLEQLARDLEILRERFEAQTEIVNTDIGTASVEPAGQKSPSSSAIDLTELKQQIDALLTIMRGAFTAVHVAVPKTEVKSSPQEDFRDRQAYLDLLKSARNSASLDELHDYKGASLVRLNFHTTVIPTPRAANSLGAIQIKVIGNQPSREEKVEFIKEWFAHLNGQRENGKFGPDTDVYDLARAGQVHLHEENGVETAMPTSAEFTTVENLSVSLTEAEWNKDIHFTESLTWLSKPASRIEKELANFCGRLSNVPPEAPASTNLEKLLTDVTVARQRVATYLYERYRKAWGASTESRNLQAAYSDASYFLDEVADATGPVRACEGVRIEVQEQAEEFPRLVATLDAVTGSLNARIYEVGPREQAQQISTESQAASSLALAASIAASRPEMGQSAKAALAYSRQAMGKASTLERVPAVVGYTVGSNAFGWILAPKPVIDTKQVLTVEQLLRTYDLSVDMSVPALWKEVKLSVVTQWGPSEYALASGTLTGSAIDFAVPMPRNAANYDWFTVHLAGTSAPSVRISQVNGVVNACTESTLVLSGRNVWRAERVMVMGKTFDASSINITPNMDGIIISMPPIQPHVKDALGTQIVVYTPSGRGIGDVDYVSSPSGEDCKPASASKAANQRAEDPKRFVIESVSPDLNFVVPGNFAITYVGKNLDQVKEARLHGQRGALSEQSATLLRVEFTSAVTISVPADNNPGVTLELLDGKGTRLDSRHVRTSRNGGP